MASSPENKGWADDLVGSEIPLDRLLDASDLRPLLKTMARAGASLAGISDEKGLFFWTEGSRSGIKTIPAAVFRGLSKGVYEGLGWRAAPLYHEGEPIGFLFLSGCPSGDGMISHVLMEIASTAIRIMIRNSAKRLLTSNIHQEVVQESSEDLRKTNARLSASEKRYRDLSESLEHKVEERTEALKLTSARMLQQEKMASVGQLAAGVAHEINNPLSFIISNFRSLAGCHTGLQKIYEGLENGFDADKRGELGEIWRDVDDIIRENLEGAERISRIVVNLKGFSHIDETAISEMDIHAEIEKTLSVLASEIGWRSARIVRKFGKIPNLYGNPGLICQALLNLLLNALQTKESGLVIEIATEQKGEAVSIAIADNGAGIPPQMHRSIFDPFFTTKEVGKGTGMGLCVTHDIVASHGGDIALESEPGKGARFTITLPLKRTQDGEIR